MQIAHRLDSIPDRLFHFWENCLTLFTNKATTQKHGIASLDSVRAAACLLIVFYHLTLIVANDSHIWNPDSTSTLAGILALFGDSGVNTFFVLSGFLLFLPFAKALLSGTSFPDIRAYYLRRLFRILPGYYVTLFLMIFLFHPEYLQADHFQKLSLFLTFLMGFDLSQSLNGPFWTLAIEMQFYMVLPVLALVMSWIIGQRSFLQRFILLTGCLVLLILWGICTRYAAIYANNHPNPTFHLFPTLLKGMLFFIYGTLRQAGQRGNYFENFGVGMFVCLLYVSAIAPGRDHSLSRALHKYSTVIFSAGMVFLFLMAIWEHAPSPSSPWGFLSPMYWLFPQFSTLGYGLVYGLLILGILFGADWLRRPLESMFIRWIGFLSYGIYMWHLPLLRLATPTIITLAATWNHAVLYSMYWGWFLVCVVPVAVLLYILIETPCIQLGQRLIESIHHTSALSTNESTP